jgi:hypothetical protein
LAKAAYKYPVINGEFVKRSFYLALAALVLALPGLVLLGACSAPSPIVEPKAAIIDQLYTLEPNQAFIDTATGIIESSGLQVDNYRGEEITVDFYRHLPTLGYKLIIFRSHSGLQSGTVHQDGGDKPIQRTYLFTNETYSERAQVFEQLSDRLAKVRIDNKHPWMFGIVADFVRHSMQGQFNGTFVIMMGCSTLDKDDLARSFVEKGASACTGWNASVGLDYVDHATITLLERLVSNNVSLETAVRDTMQEKSADPNWGAVLKYYPGPSGYKTLAELIK